MRGRLTSLLLSWPLLLSLAALITNDLYLKYAFPGLLTGKLSDFAGIFLVSFLAYGLWPKRRLAATATIVSLFIVWKSPLSQPLIDALNSVAPVRFARVVDYWDLLAFSIMPLARLSVTQLANKQATSRRRSIAVVPVALLTVVAVAATSVYMPSKFFQVQESDPEQVINSDAIAARLQRVADNYGAKCRRDDADGTHNITCYNREIWLECFVHEPSGTAQFHVRTTPRRGMFGPVADADLLERLAGDLEAEFARMPNVEYVAAPEEEPYRQIQEFHQVVCDEDPDCKSE